MNRHFAVMVAVDYGNARLDFGDLSGEKGTNPKDDPHFRNARRIENVGFQWGFRIHLCVCMLENRERDRKDFYSNFEFSTSE